MLLVFTCVQCDMPFLNSGHYLQIITTLILVCHTKQFRRLTIHTHFHRAFFLLPFLELESYNHCCCCMAITDKDSLKKPAFVLDKNNNKIQVWNGMRVKKQDKNLIYTYIKVKLVSPVADGLVFSCFVLYLVLVDIVTAWGISILIELYRTAGNAWRCEQRNLIKKCRKCYTI